MQLACFDAELDWLSEHELEFNDGFLAVIWNVSNVCILLMCLIGFAGKGQKEGIGEF